MSPTPLILDVDTGVDDALALLYALASPEVELITATCVMGNVTVERAVENTLAVLELAGRADIEVARGAGAPLVRPHEPFSVVHGEGGLGRSELASPSASASARSAVEVIVETARARPGEVLLVATGAMTNVANALLEEPSLPSSLKGFALMGGAYGRGGNTTPSAEANIWFDPHAAQAVFRGFAGAAGDKLPICVGLDVTEKVQLTRGDLDSICEPAPGSRLAQFLQEAVPFYIEFYARARGYSGACMHDPLALAIAIDPELAQLRSTRVEVETDAPWTHGMTVTDLGDIRHSPWLVGWEAAENARVALEVDAPAFMGRFIGRLRSLVQAQA